MKLLEEEIAAWRSAYIKLGRELGHIINEQQDTIVALELENKRLKRENWNLKQKRRRR